jgi:toxin ParE1/3/4
MVIWTPRARADLKAIHDYIAEHAPLNAKTIVLEMVQKADTLAKFPLLGK